MIRVNLAGTPRKKTGKAAAKAAGPSNILPIVHLLIMVGTTVAGYLWYSQLTTKSADLAQQITAKEAEMKALDAVIKQDAIFEARKAELERRIKIIDDLKKSQTSPVVMLDRIVDSVDRTNFVWLSTFTQNNSQISMVGTASNLEAIATFYANLEDTGYFHNINLQRFEDSRGAGTNVAFSLTSDFAPPAPPKSAEKGAN
jgi:Tfp pilus assembly protein PilN